MDENKPFSVSWSSLSRFMECPQKFKLIAEHKADVNKNSRNFLPGRVIDLVCRDWLDNPTGQMVDALDETMDRAVAESKESETETLIWRDSKDRANVKEFCRNAIVNLQPILEREVLPYDYEQAKWFNEPIKITDVYGQQTTIFLKGEMDILVRDPADMEWVVWDLKGTGNPQYYRKCIGQLNFYGLAVLSMFKKLPKRSGIIQPAVEPQVVEFTYSKDERSKLLSDIIAMYHSVQKEELFPKAGYEGCSVCECRKACDKFQVTGLQIRSPFSAN